MNSKYGKISLAAMFMAIGLLLPFITMQIPQIGKMLCPMHIPVFLCGLICGEKYGLAVGFITPLLRSVLFGMPAIYPDAVGMAFELASYGFFVAVFYALFRKKNIGAVYGAMIPSMLIGRVVWGIARAVMLGLSGAETAEFSIGIFITSGFVNALPGIALQLVLVPAVMAAANRWRINEQGR